MLYLTLIITLLLIRSSIKKYDRVFNPFTLSLQIPLLFLLIPQIIAINIGLGEDYLLSDIVILLNILFIYIGSRINCRFGAVKEIENVNLISIISICIVCVLFFIMFPLLISYGLSLKGVRDFYEAVVFSPYASLYEISKTLLIIIVILQFLKTQKLTAGIFIVAFFLIFSGSKMAILSTLIVFVTMYEEYKKVNYTYMAFFLLFSFILMLLYHYSQSSQTEIGMAALSYFDLYKQQSIVIDMLQRNQMDYYNGQIYISSWYKLIPRLFWPDKPVDYGFALLNYKIYPEYSAEGYMPSFGLGYAYADLGFCAVALDGFLTGFSRNFFYSIFKRSNKNNTSFILYILTLNIVTFILLIAYSFCDKLKLKIK